jgi:uncharacterized protein
MNPDVLNNGKIIQIAFIDHHKPYIVTLNYEYVFNSDHPIVYFHFANEGKKINCIKENLHVCSSISICDEFIQGEEACDYGMNFRSIVGYGRMRMVENKEEKIYSLNLLMKQYTGRDSWN